MQEDFRPVHAMNLDAEIAKTDAITAIMGTAGLGQAEALSRAYDAGMKAPITPPAGPLVPFERAVIDAAMARLERWHKDEPGGLLPADHPRGLTGTARDLVVACLALEKARLGATSGGK